MNANIMALSRSSAGKQLMNQRPVLVNKVDQNITYPTHAARYNRVSLVSNSPGSDLELEGTEYGATETDTPPAFQDSILGTNFSEDEGLLHDRYTGDVKKRSSNIFMRRIEKRSGSLFHFVISFYWFGWFALWLPALISQIIPAQISLVARDQKNATLALMSFLGSILGVFLSPLFGSLSDHSKNRLGRRRPFMLLGTIVATLGLLVMAFSPPLTVYILAYVIASIGNNLIAAPYSAIIPDVIKADDRGHAAGWLGVMSMLGSLFGGCTTFFLNPANSVSITMVFLVLIAVHGVSAYMTIRFVEEDVPDQTGPAFSLSQLCTDVTTPFKDLDFRYLFISRFMIQMGVFTMQQYMQYFLEEQVQTFVLFDTFEATDVVKAQSILYLPLVLGSVCSSIIAGVVSDRTGRRKFLIYISGTIMAIVCLLMSVTRSFSMCFVLSFFFGIGYGIFSAIDWALAADVMPSKSEYGKDMGIWAIALVLPQVFAVPFAGIILAFFKSGIGFAVIYFLDALYFAGGSYTIKFLQKVK
eukprot:82355_1